MVCVALLGAAVMPAAQPEAGWRPLFDGKSLKGWEPHGDALWRVVDSAIVCDADKPGWLGTAESFSDFELQVEFRAGAKINSGIFLRSQKEGPPAETGYELQIWDFRPTFKTGALVNSLEAKPAKIKADEWNRFEVRADGDHFVVVLNGETVLDGRDAKHRSGVVGLQYNTGTGRIEFRNIRIRSIKR
jgi:hypothetical protein